MFEKEIQSQNLSKIKYLTSINNFLKINFPLDFNPISGDLVMKTCAKIEEI